MNKEIFFDNSSNSNIEFIYIKNSNLSYKEHNHISIYTIGILLNGEIKISTKEDSYYIKENDFYIFSPYEPHSIKCIKPYSLITICLNKNYLYTNNFINKILSSFSNFLKKYNLPLDFILTLYKIITQNSFKEKSYSLNKYFETVKNTIELYPENNISVQNIANCAFVSEYHTIRTFKALYGLSPYKFQLQNRINKSKYLLKDNYTITEIAFLMGFYDQSHFINQFKNLVGISPSEYKKSLNI